MFNTCTTKLNRRERLRALRPFFIAFLLMEACVVALKGLHPAKNSPLAYALAIGMSLFLSTMIFILVGFSNRQRDEFQRKLFMEAVLWSTAATLALTTLWGCLETFTNAPHIPILAIFPIFIVIMGIARVTLFRRNPVGQE